MAFEFSQESINNKAFLTTVWVQRRRRVFFLCLELILSALGFPVSNLVNNNVGTHCILLIYMYLCTYSAWAFPCASFPVGTHCEKEYASSIGSGIQSDAFGVGRFLAV